MRSAWIQLVAWVRREPVLSLSFGFAFLSIFLVPPSGEYLSYIDFKTIACLFCLMASIMGLQREGVLEKAALFICSKIHNSRLLILFLVFACFFLSMLLTNDVALIAIVPLTITILSTCSLEHWSAYTIVLQTIAANIGSAMTPFGNPQNLYLFTHYHMEFPRFLLTMFPIVACGGLLLLGICFFIRPVPLSYPPIQQKPMIQSKRITLYSILFLLSVASVFDWVPYNLLTVVILLLLLALDKSTLAKVDYSLLATFLFVFIFVGNLGKIDSVHAFLSLYTQKNTFAAAIVTSQLTSNVPAAILLSGFTENAYPLLLGVNVGGLGTLIASMASVISYKFYASHYKNSTLRYLGLFTFWNLIFLGMLSVVGTLFLNFLASVS